MDPKIMGAVLASIAAVAIGTGGGSLQIEDLSTGNMLGQFTESPTSILPLGEEKQKDPKKVIVTARIDNISKINIESERVHLEDVDSLYSEDRRIESDGNITLDDFSGIATFKQDGDAGLDGSISGFSSSGVNVQQDIELAARTDAKRLEIIGIDSEKISLEPSYTKIRSENSSTVIEKENSPLKVSSFRGNITYYTSNTSLEMSGNVTEVKAGKVSFGN
ncbi:hypothetical protein GLU26_00380 [Nanohaloarchaea archaeon]|nr:hypothetical protein [Candidatus Nanohaloarchaea archaeon]